MEPLPILTTPKTQINSKVTLQDKFRNLESKNKHNTVLI